MIVLSDFVEISLANLAPPLGQSWKIGTLQYLIIRFARMYTSKITLRTTFHPQILVITTLRWLNIFQTTYNIVDKLL